MSAPTHLQAVTNPGGYDYLLALPKDYTARPRTRWPLLLFLHGAGQRGTGIWAVTEQGLPKLLAAPPTLTPPERRVAAKIASSFIVLAPQCPQLEVWDDGAVIALLEAIATQFRVDPARIYLTGLSMGAFGAWSLGMRHPERFAALVPICGGGRLADITSAQRKRKAALRQLGVWAFHGAQDRVVPLEESERMTTALKKIGADDVRLTVYPDAGHDSWTPAYATPAVYTWLLKHAR